MIHGEPPSEEALKRAADSLVESLPDLKLDVTRHHVTYNKRTVAQVRARTAGPSYNRRWDGVEIVVQRSGVMREQAYRVSDTGEIPDRCFQRIRELLDLWERDERAWTERARKEELLAQQQASVAAEDSRLKIPRVGRVAVALECDLKDLPRLRAALATFDQWKEGSS